MLSDGVAERRRQRSTVEGSHDFARDTAGPTGPRAE